MTRPQMEEWEEQELRELEREWDSILLLCRVNGALVALITLTVVAMKVGGKL